MTNKLKLYRARTEMKDTFRAIKNNPLDLNRIMKHMGQLSETMDTLIDEVIGKDFIFELHMEMLGKIPDGYTRQQVAIVQHWRDLGRVVKAGNGIDLTEIDPRKLWFWSDQHFGHKKIIEFSNRPFGSLDHMHQELAKRYKTMTKPGDIVVWCGDVSFMGTQALAEIMKDYTQTYNILVVGNHDIERDGGMRSKLIDHFDEVHTSLVFGKYIVTHHPWVNNLPEGMVNIHGHLHDRPFSYKDHICACVEMTHYAPITLHDLDVRNARSNL